VDIQGKEAIANFTKFKGVLYHDGKKAAIIEAGAGKADSSRGVLDASDHARFASELFDTDIHADHMEWRSKENVIVAAGNVEVRRGHFLLRAPGAVFADTAGGRIWINSQEESMRLHAAILPMIGMMSGQAGAPKDVIQYGTVTLSGYQSVQVDLSKKDAIAIVCKGASTRLVAPEQGLEISGASINVSLAKDPKKKGEFRVTEATATGGLKFSMKGIKVAGEEGASSSSASGSANKALYNQSAGEMRLIGNVDLNLSHPQLEEPGMHTTADEAIIKLDPDTYKVLDVTFLSNNGTAKTTATPKKKP